MVQAMCWRESPHHRASSPLGYLVPNLVSFVASIAELAHGEKLHTQSLNHPAYLIPWKPKQKLRNFSNVFHWKAVHHSHCQHISLAPCYSTDIRLARLTLQFTIGMKSLLVRFITDFQHTQSQACSYVRLCQWQ